MSPQTPATWQSEQVTLAGDSQGSRTVRTSETLGRGETIGRYVVLDRIGRGGMGEVYSAYDPELDRKLALKLISIDEIEREAGDQARLLREAQATAQLNHPNVVTVHDVGTHAGRVFVAMEFVGGGTLRDYVDRGPHPWREVLDRFVAAGRGLAAAHRAGLIHRDFKPANVLVGDEGRLRVADFGLARKLDESDPAIDVGVQARAHSPSSKASSLSTRLTMTGARLGTPAYMAPEQYEGSEVDARADQFGFCVALWEALHGERPFAGDHLAALMLAIAEGRIREPPRSARVPTWLRKVVARGLAVDPGDRWPDMDALLVALGRDRSRRSLGWALAGTLGLMLAALTSAVLIEREPAAIDVCEGAEQAFADAFDDDDRAAIGQRFADSGAQATAALLLPRLDAWTDEWHLGWREACEATHVRHEQSEELLDRRMSCLERRRRRFAAFIELLRNGEGTLTREALAALAAVGSPAQCSERDELLARMPPPSEPERRATIERLAGELDEIAMLLEANELVRAEQRLTALAPELEAADWPPLLAELHALRGDTLGRRREFERADPELTLAIDQAIAIGDDRLAVHALADQAEYLGEWKPDANHGIRLLGIADALIERLGGDPAERSRVAVARSRVYVIESQWESALAAAEQALGQAALAEPEPGMLTANAEHALGMAMFRLGRYDLGRPHVERALALWTATLGPTHRLIAKAHNALGLYAFVLEQPDEAIAHFEAQLPLVVALHGPEHIEIADVRANLGNAYVIANRYADARTQLEQAIAIRVRVYGPGSLYVGHARANLANVLRKLGDLDGALEQAEAALAIIIAIRGEQNPDVSPGRNVLALVHEDRGEFELARAQYLAALALLERPEGGNVHFMYEELISLARMEIELGRPDDAMTWLDRAAALELEAPDPDRGEFEWIRARALALLGRRDEARERAERALVLIGTIDPETSAAIRAWLDPPE
ncbi:protein kinase domain-containing protein [Nannocystaceae bacterium ST9]